MDDSLLCSVLSGILLLLALAWIVVLRGQLWKAWLAMEYESVARAVAGELGLTQRRDLRPRLAWCGRSGPVRLSVRWLSGFGGDRVAVVARRRLRRRTWVGDATTPAEQIVVEARRLVSSLPS